MIRPVYASLLLTIPLSCGIKIRITNGIRRQQEKEGAQYMIRAATAIALTCVVAVPALQVARTSAAIMVAEPRDIPVTIDWFVRGGVGADEDSIHIQPLLCALMGKEVSIFAKWHEYGHYLYRSGSRREQEDAADAYAARHAPREITQAAIKWLWDTNGAGDDVHRPGRDRARFIARAARG